MGFQILVFAKNDKDGFAGIGEHATFNKSKQPFRKT